MNFERAEEDDRYVYATAESFRSPDRPYKTKKIELMREVGLPVARTDVIDSKDVDHLEEAIQERLKTSPDLVMRFAYSPDRFGSPTTTVDDKVDTGRLVKQVKDQVLEDRSIKQILLQDFMPPEQLQSRIIGRYTLENNRMIPISNVLEMYKGAKSTGLLNGVDIGDPRLLRFTKKHGGFLKQEGKVQKLSQEMLDTIKKMEVLQPKFELLREIVARSKNAKTDDTLVSFEFFVNCGKLIFTDFD